MSNVKRLLIALAGTAFIWCLFSWPLPAHLFTGIPSSAGNPQGERRVRPMIQGDHLQLLYNFWLAGDMAAGNTPLFYNLYEFNTGDDALTYKPKSYYAPFSLVYKFFSLLGGRAFGWNATGFLTLWLIFFTTWLLARRYTQSDAIAALAAGLSITQAILWTSLMGGSPTGYALLWVPLLWLGIDCAIRDHAPSGGVLAGAALLFCALSDTQVFFLISLSAPVWCLVTFFYKQDLRLRDFREYTGILKAFLPMLFFLVPTFFYITFRKGDLTGSAMESGRTLTEVALYSPLRSGLFLVDAPGISSHIRLGYATLVLLLGGLIGLVLDSARNRRFERRRHGILLILFTGLALLTGLALGTHGPFEALPLKAARKLIPMYEMIRQPVKVFSLMPTLLAVTTAVILAAFNASLPRGRTRQVLFLATGLFLLTDNKLAVRPAISLLDLEQAAYHEAALDAASREVPARALVIPIWPGDSSWSSLYQHYASLYRLRMVNGYHPVVSKDYFENTFRRFDSFNKGELADAQIDDLLDRGIDYLILHENAFPEQVSPFAVSWTLERLLKHPRLGLLAESNGIWTFRMTRSPQINDRAALPTWPYIFPTKFWEAEHSLRGQAFVGEEIEASRGRFVRLESDKARVQPHRVRTSHAQDLRYQIRVRGQGALRYGILVDGLQTGETILPVTADDWIWQTVHVNPYRGQKYVEIALYRQSGAVDVDYILFAAGKDPAPATDEAVVIPAPCFFHAGHTDLEKNAVVLRPSRIPSAGVLYGPRMPLAVGPYEIEVHFDTDAEPGTLLGEIGMSEEDRAVSVWHPLRSGVAASYAWDQSRNVPFLLVLKYNWNAELAIQSIAIRKRGGS